MNIILISIVCIFSVMRLCSGDALPQPLADPGPQPKPSPDPEPKPDPKPQPGPHPRPEADPKPDPKADPEADPFLGIGLSVGLNTGVRHHYSHRQHQSCHSHGNLLGTYPHCYSVSKFCRLMVASPHLLARLRGLSSYFRKYCYYNINQGYGIGYNSGLGQHGHYDDNYYNDYDHGHGGYIYPDYGIGHYGRSGYGY